MVDGIGHPPNNNTKQHKNKQIWYNNLHYTHHDFYMYLGMTIVEQPTLLFCRHNKFCYDLVKIYQVNLEMKQQLFNLGVTFRPNPPWWNHHIVLVTPFSRSRTHLNSDEGCHVSVLVWNLWYQQMAKGVRTGNGITQKILHTISCQVS